MYQEMTNAHVAMRKLLIRYMADYTNSTSAPRDVKSGFFAIHMTDTNQVWLGETQSFADVLRRFKAKGTFADCVEQARKRGAHLELWFLTQPHRFSAQKLEDELWRMDCLADRKERDLSGPGMLYVIRHDVSHDYFVVADRTGAAQTTLVSNFLARLNNMRGQNRNQLLDQFINEQASDIMRGRGFTISPIEKFDDKEDEWLKRQCYIDECQFGRNLNWHNVE